MAQEIAGQGPFAEYLRHFDSLIGDRRTGRTVFAQFCLTNARAVRNIFDRIRLLCYNGACSIEHNHTAFIAASSKINA